MRLFKKYSLFILFTVFLTFRAYSQKNRCYLYINENDCANCNAGAILLRDIAIGLEPVVIFGNMSKEEAEFGAKEILHLDKHGIPYIVSEDIKKMIVKATKRITSSLVVVNSKNKILFECDIKNIPENIKKINSYAVYTFENRKVVLPKKEVPVNFGTTILHVADSTMCIKDNLSNIAFYSTNTWKKKVTHSIKDIPLISLYQAYYGDTVYFSNYLKEIEVYKKHNLPYLSVSDRPVIFGDTTYITISLTVPQKTEMRNGQENVILGNIHFLCQYQMTSQKTKIFPVYNFNEKDTLFIEPDHVCIIDEKNNLVYMSFYPKQNQKEFIAVFEKTEKALKLKAITPLAVPEYLLNARKYTENVNILSDFSLINRMICFTYGNQIYDMSTKKWHTLPVENGKPSYVVEKGLSTNHMFVNMSVYRGKIYAIEQVYDDLYYLIIDKNLQLESKIKLPKFEAKSNYVIHKGRVYYINKENELIELW